MFGLVNVLVQMYAVNNLDTTEQKNDYTFINYLHPCDENDNMTKTDDKTKCFSFHVLTLLRLHSNCGKSLNFTNKNDLKIIYQDNIYQKTVIIDI